MKFIKKIIIFYILLMPNIVKASFFEDVTVTIVDNPKRLSYGVSVTDIDKNGNYFLNLGEEEIAISLDELKDKAFVIFDANPEIEVVFKGDESADFQSVAAAMAAIQSVGIAKIGIVTSGYDD